MSTERVPADADAPTRALPPTTLPRECADWRTRVAEGDSCEDIAVDARFSASTVAKHVRGGDGCNHGLLDGHPEPITGLVNGPGVHDVADENVIEDVRVALGERLDANVGGTVYFSTGQLVDGHAIGFAGQRVSAALAVIADDDGGLCVERTNPGANQARWMATRAGGDEQ